MQDAIEAAIAELVFESRFDPTNLAEVDDWLARHGISADDARAIRESELPKLMVYRNLVRAGLRNAIELAIPRSMARLGPLFDEYFDRFLRERGPRTHYLRDVGKEMVDFCAPLWQRDPRIAEYLIDLARLESLHIEIAAAPALVVPLEDAELGLDSRFAFDASVRLLVTRYAVHRLPEANEDRTQAEPIATTLLVYRDAEHDVRYLELSEMAASIVAELLAGASLQESVVGAARKSNRALDSATLDQTAVLLSDLAKRGVVLGLRRQDQALDASLLEAPGSDPL